MIKTFVSIIIPALALSCWPRAHATDLSTETVAVQFGSPKIKKLSDVRNIDFGMNDLNADITMSFQTFFPKAKKTKKGFSVLTKDLIPASKVLDTDIKASFVIDYDQQALTPIYIELDKKIGKNISAADLIRYTAEHINKKDYSKAFDLASQVAKSKTGDCTEHAVLLAALMRHYKIPARFVAGVVVIMTKDKPQGIMHAWTEYFTNSKWQIGDSALFGLSQEKLYVPIYRMSNEGYSYTTDLMSETFLRLPKRLIISR